MNIHQLIKKQNLIIYVKQMFNLFIVKKIHYDETSLITAMFTLKANYIIYYLYLLVKKNV